MNNSYTAKHVYTCIVIFLHDKGLPAGHLKKINRRDVWYFFSVTPFANRVLLKKCRYATVQKGWVQVHSTYLGTKRIPSWNHPPTYKEPASWSKCISVSLMSIDLLAMRPHDLHPAYNVKILRDESSYTIKPLFPDIVHHRRLRASIQDNYLCPIQVRCYLYTQILQILGH